MNKKEINRQVAEKIMGWNFWEYGICFYDKYGDVVIHAEKWKPTDDMNQAMDVSNRLTKNGVISEHYYGYDEEDKWSCGFYNGQGIRIGYALSDKSLAEAICLAALDAAKEIKKIGGEK